jgi:hypothetical protein
MRTKSLTRAFVKVEPLELEPGFIRPAVHALHPRVDLGVPAERGSSAETGEKRLVVDATANEWPVGRVAGRGVALGRRGARGCQHGGEHTSQCARDT